MRLESSLPMLCMVLSVLHLLAAASAHALPPGEPTVVVTPGAKVVTPGAKPPSSPSEKKVPEKKAKATPTPSEAEIQTLRIGVIGRSIDASGELKDYLKKMTGKEIVVEVLPDVQTLIKAFKEKQLEFSYTGPVSYTRLKEAVKVEPLVAVRRGGSTLYQSVVVVDGAARFRQPADFRSKKIGFVRPPSLSGYWIPRYELYSRKIVEGGKLGYVQLLLTSHEDVAEAIESGKIDAGGMSKSVYRWLVQKKKINPSKVAVYLESSVFPEYTVASRVDLPSPIKTSMRRYLLILKDQELLKKMRIEGFGPIAEKDFDAVRMALTAFEGGKER